MHGDIENILMTEKEIAECVRTLGAKITEDYRGKELTAAVILRGSLVFAADLIRKIELPLTVDFIQASSYGSGTETSGTLNITHPLADDPAGRHLLLIEDIIDSGVTLLNLREQLKSSGALSVKTCTLLSKPARRRADIEADYTGKVIEDNFVVGYGLDYNQKYRNLPYIGILKREVYE